MSCRPNTAPRARLQHLEVWITPLDTPAPAGVQRERRRANFQRETSEPPPRAMDPGVLAALTRRKLYEHAGRIGVKGRGKRNKAQLIAAVRHARQAQTARQ